MEVIVFFNLFNLIFVWYICTCLSSMDSTFKKINTNLDKINFTLENKNK